MLCKNDHLASLQSLRLSHAASLSVASALEKKGFDRFITKLDTWGILGKFQVLDYGTYVQVMVTHYH
jgi:hypothetical protein